MTHKSKFAPVVGIFFALLFVCAGSAAAQSRKTVGAAEATGTYRDYFEGKSRGAYNEIKISAAGKGRLEIGFGLIYPYLDGAGRKSANLGTAFGSAKIAADTALFTMPEYPQCRITVKFIKPGRIEVAQNGADSECGFGANVSASGTYKKISRAKPRFKAVN